MTFKEICESLRKANLIEENKIGERTVQNYLAELVAIEIIIYDRSFGIYKFAENEKQVYESQHDYQVALTHSKNLLFSNRKENTQRLDHTNPYLAIDLLVYEPERDADDFATLQHLKTGYHEIFEALQKYRQLMDETGLSKCSCLPKLGGSIDFGHDNESFYEFDNGLPKPPNHKPIPATLPNTLDDEVIDFGSGTLGRDDVIARVSSSKVKEILDLRDFLVGRIYGYVMNAVRNGIPLRGRCDFCPNIEITIKGK